MLALFTFVIPLNFLNNQIITLSTNLIIYFKTVKLFIGRYCKFMFKR